MAPKWVILERRLLASGKVRVTVSIRPGKQVHFTMDPNRADDERVAALVAAAEKSGRFDPLPPRSFD